MEFTHIANPVRVQAQQIRDVIMIDGDHSLTLEDGSERLAGPSMTARYAPQAGDYLVMQEDGYLYINPKDVFERKYRVIGDNDNAAGALMVDELVLRREALDLAVRAGGPTQGIQQAAEIYLSFLKGEQK